MPFSSFAARCVRGLLFGVIASAFVSSVSGQTPAVTVSGTPASAIVGQTYTFQPGLYNPGGRPLFFGILNSPQWLTLDDVTGILSGVPGEGDVGTYAAITLIVTDGITETMYPFDVTVVPPPPPPSSVASVTLSWMPPTQNTDSSALVNLAGYRIYYGPTPHWFTHRVDVANPGIAAYVVDNLTSGLWYFTVTAYNTDGIESTMSDALSQLIQ